MVDTSWGQKPPPTFSSRVLAAWRWPLRSPADLTRSRRQLRARLDRQSDHLPRAATAEDIKRLMLAFEELASNGLRHGRQPVTIEVTGSSRGWLLDVTDTATDRAPTPAIDRDPANGGLGLHLIAKLATDGGWATHNDHKHVWAYVRPTAHSPTTDAELASAQRSGKHLDAAREWLWRHSSQPNGDPWDSDPEHLDWAARDLLTSLAAQLFTVAHGLSLPHNDCGD